MKPEPVRACLDAYLATYSSKLTAAMEAVLRERVFPQHPLLPPASVDALRFLWFFPDFRPLACAVNRERGYCSRTLQLRGFEGNSTYEPTLESALRQVVPVADFEEDELAYQEEKQQAFIAWMIAAWKAARVVAPDLRGFLSEHDSNYVIDLDTGVEQREEDTGFVFCPSRGAH